MTPGELLAFVAGGIVTLCLVVVAAIGKAVKAEMAVEDDATQPDWCGENFGAHRW